jgi:hypothetical protein
MGIGVLAWDWLDLGSGANRDDQAAAGPAGPARAGAAEGADEPLMEFLSPQLDWIAGETAEDRADRQAAAQREFFRKPSEANMPVFSINEPPNLDALKETLTPVLTALTPDYCAIGDPDLTLYVTGTGFTASSVIHFASYDEPTTLNADGTLSTGVKPSLWVNPDVVQVYVRNGELMSTALDFTFAAPGTRTQSQRQNYGVGRSKIGDERVDERRR